MSFLTSSWFWFRPGVSTPGIFYFKLQKMTVRQINEKIDSFTSEERGIYLRALLNKFLPYSQYLVMQMQEDHKREHEPSTEESLEEDYKEFCKQQNKVIKEAIARETGEFYNAIRKSLKQESLTLETEIS